jgi:hypothetical protein
VRPVAQESFATQTAPGRTQTHARIILGYNLIYVFFRFRPGLLFKLVRLFINCCFLGAYFIPPSGDGFCSSVQVSRRIDQYFEQDVFGLPSLSWKDWRSALCSLATTSRLTARVLKHLHMESRSCRKRPITHHVSEQFRVYHPGDHDSSYFNTRSHAHAHASFSIHQFSGRHFPGGWVALIR